MPFPPEFIEETYTSPQLYFSKYDTDPWIISRIATVLLMTLFWLVPVAHFATGLHLLALSGLVLVGYLIVIIVINRPIEGVIGGILGLATSSASIPLIYAETSRVNLTLNIADPFVGLFLFICGYWTYQDNLQRPMGFIVVAIGLMWVCWAMFAAIFGAGPSPMTAAFFAIDQARWIVYLLTGIFLVSVIPLRVGVVTVAIAGVIHTPVAIAQSIIIGPLGLSALGSSAREAPITMTILGQTVETGYPIGGFAGNATALAAITLLSLAVSLFYLVRGARWQRSVSALALPWIILSLVLSGSDTTLIAGVVVVLGTIATLICQRIPNSIHNTVARSRLLFGSAGIIGGTVMVFGAWHVGIESLFTYIPLADGGNLDTRVEKYQAAFNIAREYPLFGLGGANFELVADEYIAGPVNAIHSTPFEFLAGTGVIGLLLYLVLLVVVALYAIRANDDPSTDHPMILLLCIWAIGFAMLSMLNLIWPAQTSNSVFWVLAGMVVASRETPTISSV